MASPPDNNNPPPSPSPPSPTTETPPSPPTETPAANGDTQTPPKEAPAPEKASPPPPNEKSPPENEKSPPPPEKNDSPPPPPPEEKDKGSSSPATPAPTTSPATPTPTPTAPTIKPTTPPAPGQVPATPTPPVPKTPGQQEPQPTPTTPTPTDAKTPPNNEPQSFRPPPPPNGQSESKPDSSAGQQSNDSGTPQSNGTTFLSENGKYIAIAAGVALFFVIAGLLTYYILNKKKKKPNVWPHGQMQYYNDPSQAFKGNNYYDTGHNQNWYGPATMEQKGPPHAPPGYMATPGGGWTPSPQVISSGEMSSNFSDPHNAIGSASQAGLAFSKSTFTYDELAAATNGFAQVNLLGQGGFGFVHKGVLANGTVVAVKSLKSGSGQGEREFQAEVDIISRVHHRHLVSLVGYCIAGGQRMLVYEFVANKTLEYHLHGNSGETLDWSKRLTLAVGAAKGLAYLHEDCHPRIIHRDIKAANILLDNNFEAMVADFGLAKLTQDNFTHVSTRVMGTFGYLAPEYASSGKLTEKSDVFSFGVMLLELITGRRPVDTTNKYMEDSLVDWARPLMTTALEDGDYDELVDQRLGNAYNKNEMKRMMACASASVRHSAKRRPKMSQIVRALEGSVSLDDLDNATRAANQEYGSSGDYNTRAYNEDLKKFRKMALETTGEDADDTSTYGINPSTSSDSSREMK